MTLLIGPMPCATCHRTVVVDRVGTYIRTMDRPRYDQGLRVHRCPPICGVLMAQAEEPCARRRDHRGGHRTQYAMDCAARNRRKWLPVRSIGAVA